MNNSRSKLILILKTNKFDNSLIYLLFDIDVTQYKNYPDFLSLFDKTF